MSNAVALNSYLKFFEHYLELKNVTEICINQPKEIWVEQNGVFKSYNEPNLTLDFLWKFAQLVAEYNDREISPETPTLSAKLPNGLRVQFVIPPACEKGTFVCAIRQKSVQKVSINDYFLDHDEEAHDDERILYDHYHNKNYNAFLEQAVLTKKNIIISGGTSTGKTTLLNEFVNYIPLEERLITIETDREVILPHLNKVHLLAAEEGKSVANINMLGLLKTGLRLRPDRILVSELRAEEAFPYLRSINSGHPGSITTLHADSPERCFEQIAFMVLQGGSNLTKDEIISFAKSIINVVVQIKRTPKGERYISEVYYDQAKSIQSKKGSDNVFKCI